MKHTLLFFALAICATSCQLKKGPVMYESGIVVEKQYAPDTRQTVTGTGFSSKGGIVVTSHEIGEDERYTVIFKCAHGVVFSINRSDLFGNLERGDSVTIQYNELKNGDGEVKDFEFIDARRK